MMEAVVTLNGCEFSYQIQGTGPVCVFVQGVGLHGQGWRPQIEGLAKEFCCLSYDNRGIGRSRILEPQPLSIELMATDTLMLIDHLGIDRFHLVGHSMGGHISQEVSLRVPERILSLTLMCTSACGRNMPPMTWGFLRTSLQTVIGSTKRRRQAFLRIVLPDAIWQNEDLEEWHRRLEPIFGHDLAKNPPIATRQIRAYRAFDRSKELTTLSEIATLVVSGEEDMLSPPALGKRLASLIPTSRFIELAGAAHGLTITHAQQVNQILRQQFSV